MTYFLPDWLRIGKKNCWIAEAYDPPFTEKSFLECKEGIPELTYRLCLHGNWSLGSAFWFQDVCFIQQVDGGDEWLTIKGTTAFESVSAEAIYKKSPDEWAHWLADVYAGPIEACLKLDYRGHASEPSVALIKDLVKQAPAFGEAYMKRFLDKEG